MEDSALDNALSEDERAMSLNLAEQLSKIDTAPPQEVPPREGLYSTPLSWERPQPGLRMDSLIGLNQQALNEAEQRRLIAIAMNPGPSMGGLGSNINLNFGDMATGFNSGFGSSYASSSMGGGQMPRPVSPPRASTSSQSRPAPARPPHKHGSISEKSSERMGSGDKHRKVEEKHKIGDRTAHNDIERKYRTNLKDKIAELREAVPALHTISEAGGVDDDGSQNSRAPKVSKVSLPPDRHGQGSWKGETDHKHREQSSPRPPNTYTSSSGGTSKSPWSTESSRENCRRLSSCSITRPRRRTRCQRTAGLCSTPEDSARTSASKRSAICATLYYFCHLFSV